MSDFAVNRTHSLTRYLLVFAGVYVVLHIVFAGLSLVLDNISGAKVLTPFLCAQFVVDSFLKHEKRVPTPDEQKVLLWRSLGTALLVEIGLFLFAISVGGVAETLQDAFGSALLLGVVGVVCALFIGLNFFLLRWSYGALAVKRLKKIGKKNNIADTFD